MIALVDGDIVAYRCAASAEHDPEGIATWRVNELVETILREVGADSFQVFLTGEDNFRYQIFPEYKANRLGKPRPVHLAACQRRLVEEWGATYVGGMEADDALGIQQCASELDNSIICSIDKDLLQIPGWHYNFVRKERTYVTPVDGLRHFYYQLLVGDSSDGIRGADGIGPVKAKKILADAVDEFELYSRCLPCFSCFDELDLNAQVLYIHQKMGDKWTPPIERMD